jgi:hypothetical protein
MVARSGVRRCVPRPTSGACAGAFAFVIAGCSGNALLVGEERPRPDPGTDDVEGPGSVNPAVPPVDVALVSDCPPSPEERQALLGCWPPRHLGSWRGFFLGIPRYRTLDGATAEFPSGDVLLDLGIDGSAHLTFGAAPEGSVAREPPPTACAPRESAPGCPTPGLVIAGFAYELAELELYDPQPAPESSTILGEPPVQLAESMAFSVRVSEPWDTWCATQGPERELGCAGGDCSAGDWLPAPAGEVDSHAAESDERGCRCDSSGCRAEASSPSLAISLQMSDDRDALRGRYRSNDSSIGEVWLEFRKSEP